VLLREVESRTHILKRLAGCFIDHRDLGLIEHSVESLIKQRVYGMALGYEDLDWEAMDKLLVELFLDSYGVPPQEMVIDMDATDDPLHGHQEGRFFHGYYGHYCYLPLYFFCGDKLLGARLREADEDPAGGCGPRCGSFCAVSAARRSCTDVRPSGSIMCWGWRRIAV